MAILNWFGKKQERVRKEGQADQKKKITPEKESTPQKTAIAKKQDFSVSARIAAHTILRGAHITEKSTMGQQEGKYVFTIFPGVESSSVRQAVESVYKVHVQKVHIVKVRAQKRRRGRFVSTYKRPDKAIVTLRKGETIDVMA